MILNIHPLILASILAVFTLLIWANIKRLKSMHIIKMHDTALTCEELEEHARKIAIDHTLSKNAVLANWPVNKMNSDYDFIREVYKSLNNDASNKKTVPPAAEWLLDNFYILEDQVKGIRKALTKDEYNQLPALKCGPLKGYARIYAIAAELVANTGGQINDKIVLNYLKAYQTHNTLYDREIWAMPLMIRLAIIGNIKHICENLKTTLADWHAADEIVEAMTKKEGTSNNSQDSFLKSFESRFKSMHEVSPSFIEHLSFRLRKSGRGYSRFSGKIDELLKKYGTCASDLIRKEHSTQAAYSVTIGNSIISLKHLASIDWSEIFEEISSIEQTLNADQVYSDMDESTRSIYRKKIEQIAKMTKASEIHIAREAIKLSSEFRLRMNSSDEISPHEMEASNYKKGHVGYYLIGDGFTELLKKINYNAPFQSFKGVFKKNSAFFYVSAILFSTALLVYSLMHYSYSLSPIYALPISILVFILVLIPSSDIAVSLVNWVVCNISKPTIFPRMELKEGIPKELSTLVVIPALLPDKKRVSDLLSKLETHYLSNKECNMYFALAGDFKDNGSKDSIEDTSIIETGLSGIRNLNRKYKIENGKDIFYYFHRERSFNKLQNKWMGWERKRGALTELNSLLMGSDTTSYTVLSSGGRSLPQIKYVITLDSDTILPISSAKKLVGIMAHPLNKPEISKDTGIVADGYGLIQPHISFDIESTNKTLFSKIFTGQEGIDPYSCAISDVYQDIFNEGSFTGKGIYDLGVFHSVLKDAIPENTVLSHDLLEGSYVRCGLASNIDLIDSFPSSYSSYAARMHRWTRGDWQLLPWLLSTIRNSSGNSIKNPLNAVSTIKIIDNIRRSLLTPSLYLLIISGFSILPGSSIFWLGFALFTMFFPAITSIIDSIISLKFMHTEIKRHNPVISGLKATLYQILLQFVLLPYQAYLIVSAVITTLYRVFISRKNMLEWVTAADVEKSQKNTVTSYWNKMSVTMPLSVALFSMAAIIKPLHALFALPIMIIWSTSPFIAYWMSKQYKEAVYMLPEEDVVDLKAISRKTWRYFEEFINYKNNFLPPDNYQEDPPNGVAYRTSPTNIGLGLMAFLTARDMGYIGTHEMHERIQKTLSTLDKLEKWNGHFYNWYDTRTLYPLKPRYVSTVDSGNLVCYLVTLEQGLKEYLTKPIVDEKFIDGIHTEIHLAQKEYASGNITDMVKLDKKDIFPSEDKNSLFIWRRTLDDIKKRISNMPKKAVWSDKLKKTITLFTNEIDIFMPWLQFFSNISRLIDDDFKTTEGTLLNADLSNEKNIPSQGIGFGGYYPGQEKGMGLSNKDILTLAEEAVSSIKSNISYLELADAYKKLLDDIGNIMDIPMDKSSKGYLWLKELHASVTRSLKHTEEFMAKFNLSLEKIHKIIVTTSFVPLYDNKKQLFSIGYNIDENRLTNSYYDLMASEARQTSYLAVARGEVPLKHWSKLGRTLTVVDFYRGLVSWTGTMFEYLMPLILMKNYKNTLLDETYSFVIRSQKKYGKYRGVPWGVSESGFYALDINLNYQYKAVGIPWLGLKRGLAGDTVIAPYATFLALLVDPKEALSNIKHLRKHGLEGTYGFYEAIDYTPERLPFGTKRAIVKSYMVHHEGMSLLSLNNYLNNNILQERFHRDPVVKAGELMLQEKVPVSLLTTKENKEKVVPYKDVVYKGKPSQRKFNAPDFSLPKAHILSNGSYSVMITDKGTGFSRHNDIAITRWREDLSLDNHGYFFYIRDTHTNTLWSSTYYPISKQPDKYEVIFTSDKAVFKRLDGNIETVTEITVASENNAEIRRITLKNLDTKPVELEITSYFEVVLAPQNADIAHPAFCNLFVRTELLSDKNSIIAVRRPRSESDKIYWLSSTTLIEGNAMGNIEYETDRLAFLGRGHAVSNPIALDRDKPLSNSSGSVLDPIMSTRARVLIQPGQTAKISSITGVSENYDAVLALAGKYQTPEAFDSGFRLALTRSQVEAGYLNISSTEIGLYQDMLSHILFLSPLRRANEDILKQNQKGQSSLWQFGISGDLPIITISIRKSDESDILYDLLKAHEYWRLKGLRVDLVILNEEEGGYSNPLRSLLTDIVSSSHAHDLINRPGGVFLLNQNSMSSEDITLIYSVSRLLLKGNAGSLSMQIKSFPLYTFQGYTGQNLSGQNLSGDTQSASTTNTNSRQDMLSQRKILSQESHSLTEFGFNSEGNEYNIKLGKDQFTPMPWINIIANKDFGFIVSESGSSYTWSENSREYKLTPWSNDPISDKPGEIFYLSNIGSNSNSDSPTDVWTLTSQPARQDAEYTVTHGFGYSKFEHESHGINHSLIQFVPKSCPVKISLIKLKNLTNKKQDLHLTYYLRPVLGVTDQFTAMQIRTSKHASGALLIENPYNEEFPGRVLFMDTSENENSLTGDRKEFFGDGSLEYPAALQNKELSGNTGIGFDPCGAIQISINLEANSEKEVSFILCSVKSSDEIDSIREKYRSIDTCKKSLEEVKDFWHSTLGTLRVRTPDTSMNIMLNGWLLYQVTACRLWSRSGFYQSGGAFGFRDQLQDCLSLIHIWPEIVRNQILLHAAHQYIEGDVQHWWHEPSSKGTRTRFSDDLLWLPYVTSEYLKVTSDYGILKEDAFYLEEDQLSEYEDERYGKPSLSEVFEPLYMHCVRAIDYSLKFGEHGLPLMGSGDWNDGMNTVGNAGKGESVWLGWFLYTVLKAFAPICEKNNDKERAKKYTTTAAKIADAIEDTAWDGSWYKRAYFDNGLPLGSIQNSECKIDSISQSWAVISEAGNSERVRVAMNSLENYLIQRDHGLIKLLTPPFDESELEPGYIKSYLPGVRENGGQYTHSAAWVIIAFAKLGDGDKAHELFEMVNPINHSRTHIEISNYKVEPYVMAADVYAAPPHVGRGGWTWYTGSASWYYKAGIEYLLGFRKEGENLILDPCIPKKWSGFTLNYEFNGSRYDIEVKNPDGVNRGVKKIIVDGKVVSGGKVALKGDGKDHVVEVLMG